jgi:hypothetical protein
VAPRLLSAQVSVSPQGFPNEKNVLGLVGLSFRPLFTGELFIVAEGLREGDSREVTGLPAAMPATGLLALQLSFCFEVRTLSDRLVSSAP